MMAKSKIIVVKGINIATLKIKDEVFISLTDIARNKNTEEPKDVVKNWMRSKITIEFIGIWEQLNNPDFKGVEFDSFLFEAGSNSFTLSPSNSRKSGNRQRNDRERTGNGLLRQAIFGNCPLNWSY